jgi:DNA segregation ATPase FtsK/SpoIIIE, S-DNA-T family
MSAGMILWLILAVLAVGVLAVVGRVVFVGGRWVFRWCQIAVAKGHERTLLLQAQRIRRWWRQDSVILNLSQRYRRELRDGKVKTVTVRPRIQVAAQPWGVRVRMGTVPGVGINEVDREAQHLADRWGAEQLVIDRLPRGTVEMRALLADQTRIERPYVWPQANEWVLPVGHDAWGEPVSIPLANLSGIKDAGLAGFGKTVLLMGWAASLAPRAEVQFAIFDGKVRTPVYGDWGLFEQRAMFLAGDDPKHAADKLGELEELVKLRPELLQAERGTHRFWTHGPTVTNPLVVVVVDEGHNYVDVGGVDRPTRELIESNQRRLRTLGKEGRQFGVLLIFATQKGTADAFPTAIRDNLEVGVCFATSTLEAAEAALGPGIRADKPNHPTLLRDKSRHVGVCIVTGVPGLDGKYVRVRVGTIDDHELAARVTDSTEHRRDLADLLDTAHRPELVAVDDDQDDGEAVA